MPGDCEQAQRGAQVVNGSMLGETRDADFFRRLADCDRCIVGMMLEISVYFGIADKRIDALVENLLTEQMPDGGWNCRRHRKPYPHHSSFHTTLNAQFQILLIHSRHSATKIFTAERKEAGDKHFVKFRNIDTIKQVSHRI